MFRSMVLTALGVALVAGLVLSAVQALQVSPIIYAAEVFEVVEPAVEVAHVDGDEHSHDTEAWAPNDGFERIGATVLSNFLAAFGFAILLLVGMLMGRDKAHMSTSLGRGVLWGLAGYATFFVIPALGLVPEIPGMEAAVLEGRQAWWVLSVITSVLAFISLVFLPGYAKLIAVVLFATPWVVGAPQPEFHGFAHPDADAVAALDALEAQFIVATAMANGLFWIVLGGLSGYAATRFIKA